MTTRKPAPARKDNPARAERTSSREVVKTVGEGDDERQRSRWVTDVQPARLTPGHAREPATLAATRTAERVVANSYSLSDGRAAWPERLGSGNFGIAYRLDTDDGPAVVKIATATNIHGRPWTRTEQTRNLLHEAGVANELTELGFRCMPRSVFVRFAGGTPAVVREYGEPAGPLSPEEYASLEADLVAIEREHGWRVNDDLALYRRADGSVYVGDVGFWQAPPRDGAQRPWKAMDSSLGHLLDQVQREHGVPSVTTLPRLLSSASVLAPSPSRDPSKPRSPVVERFEAELAQEFLDAVRLRAEAGVPVPDAVAPMVRQAEALIVGSDFRRRPAAEDDGRRENPPQSRAVDRGPVPMVDAVLLPVLRRHGAVVRPLGELSRAAQFAISTYEAQYIDRSPSQIRKDLRSMAFGYVEIPTATLSALILRHMNDFGAGYASFRAYHRWYVGVGDMPDHPLENPWPVVLARQSDEDCNLLEDGWHRFHDYVRKGLKVIPAVFYIESKRRRIDGGGAVG
jgi:hypothetical protein